MNQKPMDVDVNHPDFKNLKTWTRRMVANTIEYRFGLKVEKNMILTANAHPDLPRCPVCGHNEMVVVCDLIPMNKGKPPVETFYLQCMLDKGNPDHGFGNDSKHGTRSRAGRITGSKTPASAPKPVEVKDHTPAPVIVPKLDTVTHPEVARAIKFIASGERNVYFTGPAGTGKTTAAFHINAALRALDKWKEATEEPFFFTQNQAMMAPDLVGFLDRLNGGKYFMTGLVESLQRAGVTFVDEADKGNSNLAAVWNSILANNLIVTPGGTFKRHPDNVIIFVGNTTGHTPNKQYAGSIRQDYATLDRFRVFNMGFNESVESAAIPNLDPELYRITKIVRENAEKSGLQRIVGLRWLRRVNEMLRVEGGKAKDAILKTMEDEGWSNDEILASGIRDIQSPLPPKDGNIVPPKLNSNRPRFY